MTPRRRDPHGKRNLSELESIMNLYKDDSSDTQAIISVINEVVKEYKEKHGKKMNSLQILKAKSKVKDKILEVNKIKHLK